MANQAIRVVGLALTVATFLLVSMPSSAVVVGVSWSGDFEALGVPFGGPFSVPGNVIFGLFFDLTSITTDALPSSLAGARYSGVGVIGYLAFAPDLPTTNVVDASLSMIDATPVPFPASVILCAVAIVVLRGHRRGAPLRIERDLD